jgi:hypothetical protein
LVDTVDGLGRVIDEDVALCIAFVVPPVERAEALELIPDLEVVDVEIEQGHLFAAVGEIGAVI